MSSWKWVSVLLESALSCADYEHVMLALGGIYVAVKARKIFCAAICLIFTMGACFIAMLQVLMDWLLLAGLMLQGYVFDRIKFVIVLVLMCVGLSGHLSIVSGMCLVGLLYFIRGL